MQGRKIEIGSSTSEVSLSEKLDSLPTSPVAYQFKSSDDRVIYVGKAKNLRNRVRQYFQKSRSTDPRLNAMVSKISDVEVIATDNEIEALILEANLIKKFKPRYNINHKDDKSYPYIVVTNEPFPRVFVTRRIVKDGSRYFGPYTDVGTMRYALKTIRDIFRVRSCNYWIDEETIRKKKIRLCLDYHIKKCDGPCEGLISQGQYNAMTKEVEQLLKGKTASLMKSLENEMSKFSDELKYEEAAVVRDKLEALRVYTERQKVVALDSIDRDILAFAREDDDACGVVFKVRDGMLVGRQHFSMVGVEGKSEEEILESLFQRYYLDAEYVPKEVFLSQALTNTETLQQWLSEKRGEKSEIIVPKIGEKAKLVEM
ncbi:MAG: excinuclease ABC subunit UvrC, partial [Bacteroidota bacterium]